MKLIRVRIISQPQIVFPTPGTHEINVIGELIDTDYNGNRYQAIVVSGKREMPTVGSEINAIEIGQFYRSAENLKGSTRLCMA